MSQVSKNSKSSKTSRSSKSSKSSKAHRGAGVSRLPAQPATLSPMLGTPKARSSSSSSSAQKPKSPVTVVIDTGDEASDSSAPQEPPPSRKRGRGKTKSKDSEPAKKFKPKLAPLQSKCAYTYRNIFGHNIFLLSCDFININGIEFELWLTIFFSHVSCHI